MTLPSSGQLSLGDIANELGTFPSNVSINSAESGTYGAINTASPSYPDGSTPNAISEWYGYNHSAVSLTSFSLDHTGFDNELESCINGKPDANTVWHDGSGTYPASGDTIYTDSGGSNPFGGDNFYYKVIAQGNTVQINASGVVQGSSAC